MSTAAIRWATQEQAVLQVRQPNIEAGLDEVRFVWQCIEDLPHEEVMGSWIERCRVMPIVKRYRWDNIESLADNQIEPGMRRRDREGKWAEAAYSILPGYILRDVVEAFGSRGLVELTALRGLTDPQAFLRLNVDGLFFGERKDRDARIDDIPKTYAEISARIEEVRAALVRGEHDYSPEDRARLIQVADEMLRGVEIARAGDVALLDESERELELGRNNPQFKQVYDGRDLRALHRLQRSRKDYAITQMAEQQNSVTALLAEALKQRQPASDTEGLKDALQSFAREFAAAFAATQKQSATGYEGAPETAVPAPPVAPAAPKPQSGRR